MYYQTSKLGLISHIKVVIQVPLITYVIVFINFILEVILPFKLQNKFKYI